MIAGAVACQSLIPRMQHDRVAWWRLRISDFGLLSGFGLRRSDFKLGHSPLATSPGSLKGAVVGSMAFLACRVLPALAPFRAVLDDPICQGTLKSNVAAGLFGLNPLVLQDLLAFRLKFPVEGRVLQQIAGCARLFRLVRHNCRCKCFEGRNLPKRLPMTTPISKFTRGFHP